MWLKLNEHSFVNLAAAERIDLADDGGSVTISFPSGPGQRLRDPELVAAVKAYLSQAQVVAGGTTRTQTRG